MNFANLPFFLKKKKKRSGDKRGQTVLLSFSIEVLTVVAVDVLECIELKLDSA